MEMQGQSIRKQITFMKVDSLFSITDLKTKIIKENQMLPRKSKSKMHAARKCHINSERIHRSQECIGIARLVHSKQHLLPKHL